MPKIENKGNIKELKVLARNNSPEILCNMSRNPATPVCTIGNRKDVNPYLRI